MTTETALAPFMIPRQGYLRDIGGMTTYLTAHSDTKIPVQLLQKYTTIPRQTFLYCGTTRWATST